MYSKTVAFAIAAVGMATGAAAVGCSQATATIASAADATALASCDTVKGDVLISTTAGNTIDLSGHLSEITGDLTCENNGALISLSSTSLKTIGGAFTLRNVTLMSTLKFTSLNTVGSIDWQSLSALGSLSMGDTGITDAKSVSISDTFLSSLDGINILSLATMNINNNKRLTDFTTQLKNLSDILYISANGQDLSVTMPNLEWIANMTIANVTSFSAQSLAAVNGSIRFDSNYFQSVNFPNLTDVQTGDLSFVSNSKLTNITANKLDKVGGGFTIANNTELQKLNNFGALKQVGGAVLVRGSFNEIDLPQLNDVKGTFTVTSTEDIDQSCLTLEKLGPQQGGQIQGKFSCTSNNSMANNNTSGDSSSKGGSSNKANAAGVVTNSISTVVTLAALGAMVSAFL